jgi:hypothetical protein
VTPSDDQKDAQKKEEKPKEAEEPKVIQPKSDKPPEAQSAKLQIEQ